MKRFFNNHFFIVLIIAIVTAAAIIRMTRVPELGYFMLDEERDAFLVRRLLVEHRPLLVGGVIPGGINVGPFFFYLSAIPYAISKLNPIGPAYAAEIVGMLAVMGILAVGKQLFGRQTAVLAAFLSCFSLLNIIYQRPWWPLTVSQMVTLGVYLSLWKLTRSDLPAGGQTLKNWLWILVGSLIIGVQSDPSTLSLIPLPIIWLWWKRKNIRLNKKRIFLGIGIFLLAHVTWVIFEFRHNFLSIRAIMGLFQGLSLPSQDSPFTAEGPIAVLRMAAGLLYRLFFITGPLDVTKQINPAEVFLNQRLNDVWWPGAWLLLLVICYYVINSLRRRNAARKIISLHFLISLVGILIYTSLFPGYVHEWLWQFTFPTFFLIFADVLVQLGRKKMWVIWGILGVWGIWQMSLFNKLGNIAGLGNKLNLVKQAQKDIADRPYELRSEGELRYGGWRYLFTLYGKPPVKSYMDYVYQGWLYPDFGKKHEVIMEITNPDDTIPTAWLDRLEDRF